MEKFADKLKNSPPRETRLTLPNKKTISFRPVRTFSLVACMLLAFLVLSIAPGQTNVQVQVGEIASEDVFYEGDTLTYTSALRTEAAQTAAVNKVEPIYVIDGDVEVALAADINEYFADVTTVANSYEVYDEAAFSALRSLLPAADYGNDTLLAVLNLSLEERTSLSSQLQGFVSQVYRQGVREDQSGGVSQQLASLVTTSTISGNVEVFIKTLLEAIAWPLNERYDGDATSAAMEDARAAVTSVQVTVQPGEKLVSRGSKVTAEQVEALQALGMMSDEGAGLRSLGLALLVVLLELILFFYLRIFKQEVYNRPGSMLLLAVVIVVVLILCKVISLVTIGSESDLAGEIGYLLPVSAASLLLAVLLDRDAAIIATAVLAAFVGVIMKGEFNFMLVALFGGLAGVMCSHKLNQRSQFVYASAYIILVNMLTICAWGLMEGASSRAIVLGALFGLGNGLLSAVLAMGILPFLESGFGITTVIRLLELSNSNHPLLKRLMMEAPGTYNHSVLVGNLAEAAADAIGADSLLVRVAAYYHDVGKLRRPYFYIENQQPGDNPHDRMQPALSAMAITSHPTDGAELLREQRFPPEIIAIVEQHHGDSLLSFFYNKARDQALNPDEVREEDFRYQGPLPQTREAGLVMLADAVQAAVQALHTADREAVAARVREVIDQKLDHGQLRECPLTLRDLELIYQSFLMVLAGMNHIRISYPGQEHDTTGGMELESGTSAHGASAPGPAHQPSPAQTAEAGSPVHPEAD